MNTTQRSADLIVENDRILCEGEVVRITYVTRPVVTLSCECCSDYDYTRVRLEGVTECYRDFDEVFINEEMIEVVLDNPITTS